MEGADGGFDMAEDASLAPFLQQVNAPPPTGPAVAGSRGARPAASAAVALVGARAFAVSAKAGPQTSNPTALPAVRTEAAAKAARAQQAAPRPGSTATERAEAILGQLRIRIRAGDREAIIQLNPHDLGRMKLHIRVNGGSVAATISAESAETLALLEAHAPELRAWLAKDGGDGVDLKLELFTPTDADEQSSFDRADAQGKSRRGAGATPKRTSELLAPATSSLIQALATRSADGGVDFVA